MAWIRSYDKSRENGGERSETDRMIDTIRRSKVTHTQEHTKSEGF